MTIKFDLDAFCGDIDGKKRRIGLENFSNGSKKNCGNRIEKNGTKRCLIKFYFGFWHQK